uniref:Thiol protease SEN102-like n=1 Tax=Nicotiana tabacum TaxID=4097 RepID=A0A1S4CUN5_TOBAC|nr:PREDICTED: thiol protease SEN102-like [Nicotiana tabacum]
MIVMSCCWAFAATEVITAARAHINGEIVPLSKQHLLDCMYTHYNKPTWFEYLEENECFPCSYAKAYTFARDHGIVKEVKYPFTEQRGECHGPSEEIKGFKRVNENLNKKAIENLIKQQPITCAVPHVPSFNDFLGEKVYMGPTNLKNEATKKLIEEGNYKKLCIALLIVGYGVEDGVDFYLVKNSWRKEWGHKGYAKIERGVLSNLFYP